MVRCFWPLTKDRVNSMRIRWLVAVGIWACVAVTAFAGNESAVVTQVRGNASVAQRHLDLLDPVNAGDSVEVAPGAEIVLFWPAQQQQQVTLTGPGSFFFSRDGTIRQSGSGSVRRESRDPAFAASVRRRDLVIAGAIVRATAGPAEVPGPERIAASYPVLAWQPRAHVGNWRLRVLDAADAPVFETSVASPALTLPDNVRLMPGQRYRYELRWQGRDGAVQATTVALQTLGADEDAELVRLLPAPDAALATRVLFAFYLRNLGVRGLARQIAPELNDPDPR